MKTRSTVFRAWELPEIRLGVFKGRSRKKKIQMLLLSEALLREAIRALWEEIKFEDHEGMMTTRPHSVSISNYVIYNLYLANEFRIGRNFTCMQSVDWTSPPVCALLDKSPASPSYRYLPSHLPYLRFDVLGYRPSERFGGI